MRRLCVFCASSPGRDACYREGARALGRLLASRGIGLVYGGGRVGLMGTLADAALQDGGDVIGVIPRALMDREIAHAGLRELRVVASMHARKAEMAALADGFVALPGGSGTLDEFFEMWTWGQLGLHHKPVGLLDVGGFFGPLVALIDRMVGDGFLDEAYRKALVIEEDAALLVDRLDAYVPPPPKWPGAPPESGA
jgi:uncharacterized protein (TIGR00730 family)